MDDKADTFLAACWRMVMQMTATEVTMHTDHEMV